MNKFFGELDTYLFHHGTHYKLFDKMGAHLTVENGVSGVHFVLWAPNAQFASFPTATAGLRGATIWKRRTTASGNFSCPECARG